MIGKCFAEKRKGKKELNLSREGKNGNIAEIIKRLVACNVSLW